MVTFKFNKFEHTGGPGGSLYGEGKRRARARAEGVPM